MIKLQVVNRTGGVIDEVVAIAKSCTGDIVEGRIEKLTQTIVPMRAIRLEEDQRLVMFSEQEELVSPVVAEESSDETGKPTADTKKKKSNSDD